jgi:excisionase family DNA binding protein
MERITFDQLPEMVALILEKLEHIESLLGTGGKAENHLRKEMLNSDEAASFLGLSKSSLYKLSFNRIIPVYRPTGKLIYFKRDDLVNHLQQNRAMSMDEIEQEAINYINNNPGKHKANRIAKK